MVKFEKSKLVIVILERILIEYQLWQVVFAGQDELIRLTTFVARSTKAFAAAQKAWIL